MINIIEKYINYNANTRDKNVGDCVKRALTIAFGINYADVGKELRKIKKDNNYDAWNIYSVYSEFMDNHGIKDIVKPSEVITVEEFSKRFNIGTYVVECSKKPNKPASHLVTIIDGDIYDSWDSSNQYVVRYFIVSDKNRSIMDVSKNISKFIGYAVECIEEAYKYYNERYWKKYSICKQDIKTNVVIDDKNTITNQYGFSIDGILSILDRDIVPTDVSDFIYEFSYKLNPALSLEENMKYIYSISYKMASKAVWNAVKYTNDYQESLSMSDYKDKFEGSSEEREIRNKLPGWCQRLIIYINHNKGLSKKGYGYDYEILMQPLNNDPNQDSVSFYADTFKELVWEINYYKDGFHRYGYDY